jgi:hypothetical protein
VSRIDTVLGMDIDKSVTNCNSTTNGMTEGMTKGMMNGHTSEQKTEKLNNIPKKPRNLPHYTGVASTKEFPAMQKINPKHLAFMELKEKSNLTETQIAEALNYHRSYIPELKKKLDKWSIVCSKTKRLAKKALIETLEMQAVTKQVVTKAGDVVEIEDRPTHANRLQAVSLVLERADPVVQQIETKTVSMSMDISPIDYSKYQRKD